MALVQSSNNQPVPKEGQKVTKHNKLIDEGFVSKYLLCCFSLKYKHPKSYTRRSKPSQNNNQKPHLLTLKPKATKLFDINDQPTQFEILKAREVKMPNIRESEGRLAKSEMYGMENNEVVVLDKVGAESQLNFKLDDSLGVSNTFALPFFDYNGIQQNKYYSRNKLSGINIEK